MSLTESIVEDTALKWLGELGYAVGHGPQMAPGEPAAARSTDSRRQLFAEEIRSRFASPLIHALSQAEKQRRVAIRRLNPAILCRTLATLSDTLLPKLLSGKLKTDHLQSNLHLA